MTLQYCLASMAAWLSFTSISHGDLLPYIPSIHLFAVNSSLRPVIAPQSLNYCSQPLHLPGDLIPVGVMYGGDKDFLILIPFRLPQISCFTPSLKCFSFDSDSCPDVGDWTPGSVPHPQRAGPVLLTLLFFPLAPSSYAVLCKTLYIEYMVLYILFHWSDPTVCSQLLFCMHFCV